MKEIAKRLAQAEKIIIASHYNPEGDAIGGILALYIALEKMGKQLHAYNRDGVPFNLSFLPYAEKVSRELPPWSAEVAIIVDCGDFHRVGREAEHVLAKVPLIINIDHHPTNPRFGHLNVVEPKKASASQLVAQLIDELGVAWSREMAENIYTGIVADTGSFQFSNTDEDALRTAARMVELGANPAKVANYLYYDLPERNLHLLAKALNTLRTDESGKIATIEVTKEMMDSTGTEADATEGFVDYARSVRGVEVAVLFRQTTADEYKISFRSKGSLDVAQIARFYGGGGHREAAGCTVKGALQDVKREVIEKVRNAISAHTA